MRHCVCEPHCYYWEAFMQNNIKRKLNWVVNILLLLGYSMPFSHILTYYYYDEPIMQISTAIWIAFLFWATLKTNCSHLIFPGHILSFFVSFAYAEYHYYSIMASPMNCLPISTLPQVIIVSALLFIGHIIISIAYRKLQTKKKEQETER